LLDTTTRGRTCVWRGAHYHTDMQLPLEVPVMTLENVILFPQAMLPLFIYEPRYRRMLADSLATHRMFSIAMQKPGRRRESPAPIGGLGLIRASVTNKDGTSNLILQGLARVEYTRTVRYRPYRVNCIQPVATVSRAEVELHALSARIVELVNDRLKLGFELPFKTLNEPPGLEPNQEDGPVALQAFRQVLQHLTKLEDPEQLADLVSATLLPGASERQVILETRDLEERLRQLIRFLMAEIQRRQNTQPE